MKNILKNLLLIRAFNSLSKLTKDEWINILRFPIISLIPLAIFTALATFSMFAYSFVIWELPENLYFPFIREDMRVIDRFILLFGIMIAFIVEIDGSDN